MALIASWVVRPSARTRLASDVGGGKKQFNGLSDCLIKTSKGKMGPLGLYNGFGVSVAGNVPPSPSIQQPRPDRDVLSPDRASPCTTGIIPFRGVYFGVNDTLVEQNPYATSEVRAPHDMDCPPTRWP